MSSLAMAPLVVTDLGLPLQTHQLENLFWERILPVVVVLVATVSALFVSRALVSRRDEAAPGSGSSLRRILRAGSQALVYVGIVTGALFADRALHGDPKGLDMALRFGSAVALLWAGFLSLDAIERQFHARFIGQGKPSAATLILLLDKVGKAVWAVLIALMFLDNMGMNVKALLAGLGVGGLAVALASQKTMENFFGGMVLVLDQPVRVGDVCGFNDKTAEVVEIGLRSIKLRTDDRTVITVPNGEFSQLVLENFAKRDRIRFKTNLGLGLGTGVERLRRVTDALNAVLKDEPRVDAVLPRHVRLMQVGASSLDLEVCCYFNGSDWEEFLDWRQGLLESLLEAIELEGACLSTSTPPAPPVAKLLA